MTGNGFCTRCGYELLGLCDVCYWRAKAGQMESAAINPRSHGRRNDEPMKQFAEGVLETVKECVVDGCFDCSAEDLAELAVKHGLWQYVAYDPELHGRELLDDGYETGDMMYIFHSKKD